MSSVFGPVETEEPTGMKAVMFYLGRLGLASAAAILSTVMQIRDSDIQMSYDYQKNSLKLSGESDKSGDDFHRGYVLGLLLTLVSLISVIGMSYTGDLASSVESPFIVSVSFVSMSLYALTFIGAIEATAQCEVIDHTTKPFEVDESIEKAYMEGEIGEEELEEKLEADIS